MTTIGFTGSRQGITQAQRRVLTKVLRDLSKPGHLGSVELHHGDCVGADAASHEIALQLGMNVVIHPPTHSALRAFCKGATKVHEPKPFITRNHDIVDATLMLVACPDGEERLRSGTWATVRYARKRRSTIIIISPTGEVTYELP